MKKTGAKKGAAKKTGKSSDAAGAKKASKLKPLKSKEVKRSKNPKAFEEDDDFNPDDMGLDDFDGGVGLDDDDDDF
jgi:hypothetical protein